MERLTDFLRGVCGAALVFICVPAHAADDDGTLSILFENDLFFQIDRDYTSGAEITWAPPAGAPQNFAARQLAAFPFFTGDGDMRLSYSLGQMIFTPQHTDLVTPIPTERPYAGYLYGALALTEDSDDTQSMLRLQLGMIGPSSLAADSQKYVHAVRGFTKPQGWHTQLRDEPGLILTYRRTLEFIPISEWSGNMLDIRPHFGGAIGNVFDYVNAGAMMRFGFNMPRDFGPPRLEPSLPGSYYYEPQSAFGAYVFAGLEGRAVARNLFLDGNSFQSGPRVGHNILVGDFMLGAALAFEGFQISFVHMLRSPEYDKQSAFDQFGTLALSVNF